MFVHEKTKAMSNFFVTSLYYFLQRLSVVQSGSPHHKNPGYFPVLRRNRLIQLTQCCTQFRSLGVKVLCMFH